MSTSLRRLAGLGPLFALVLLLVGPPARAGDGGVGLEATIESRRLDTVDVNEPLRLDPKSEMIVEVEVTNRTRRAIEVRYVRLEGRVLGLTFFAYTTRVDLEVEAGDSGDRRFALDLVDLDRQATGLIPSRLVLLDEEQNAIASVSFPVDVRGSFWSVYGAFGIIVAALTALLLGAALVRLAAHRLPGNRWNRAARFSAPGFGVGLTFVFTLSALRLLTPSGAASLTFVGAGGVIGFVVGYLTPSPEEGEEDEEDLEEEWEAAAGTRELTSPVRGPEAETVPGGTPPSPRP